MDILNNKNRIEEIKEGVKSFQSGEKGKLLWRKYKG